ncbi:MAG: putative molybdenum carrier protein [Xanthobacteraceae bacterium]|nr:putative molybdenum carrier protein [Xanthobacteraceae bacterium]
MKIVTGGQTGVDRAALDAAVSGGIEYGGWCPRGGWAEDFPEPPGVRAKFPLLSDTPLADPAQRTTWNIRDSDVVLILVGDAGTSVSAGTALARQLAEGEGKPTLVIDLGHADSLASATEWLETQRVQFGAGLRLGIGGPRESEAPGIYDRAGVFLGALFRTQGTD